MDKEKKETVTEEATEVTYTATTNKKKKNPIILIVILLVLIVLGLTGYILVDKGIIFGKDSKESNSKKDTNKDEKPTDKDPEKDPEKEPEKEPEKVSYPTANRTCKELAGEGNIIECKLGSYSYQYKEISSDDDTGITVVGIYNKNNVKLGEYEEYPDGESASYSMNSDGSIVKKTKCSGNDEISTCDYEMISYEGKKLSNPSNIKKIVGNYDNYLIYIENNHIKLADYKGNVVKDFDFNLNKGNYVFHSMLSGWYTEEGKKGIYLVIENQDIEFGEMGAGLEYYFEPSTGKIGTIKTEGIGGYAKPVLYLYPEKDTKVSVSFEKPELLTTTYPKFKNSWNVTAKPNGDLYDENNKYYYGLYWEESGSTKVDFTEGFYVTKESAIKFLEEKLSYIGLNDRERNEFIMYWLPILEKNNKSVVYFELTEEREAYNKLNISPNPDSLLRLAIHVKKVDKKPTNLKEEKLTKFVRKGFTAVEWGGVIHN